MVKGRRTHLTVVKHVAPLNAAATPGILGDCLGMCADFFREGEAVVWAVLIFMLAASAVSTYFFAAGLDKARRMENSLNAMRASRTNENGGQVSKSGAPDYSFTALGRGMEKGRSSFVRPVDGAAAAGEKEASFRGTAAVPSLRRGKGLLRAGIEPSVAASAAPAAPAPSSYDKDIFSAAVRGRHAAALREQFAGIAGERHEDLFGKGT